MNAIIKCIQNINFALYLCVKIEGLVPVLRVYFKCVTLYICTLKYALILKGRNRPFDFFYLLKE
jgi:hypothetical protein